MSDLTICSHCGDGNRNETNVFITTLPNGNNELSIRCYCCGKFDTIQITPAKQDVKEGIRVKYDFNDSHIWKSMPREDFEKLISQGVNVTTSNQTKYPINSKWQDPDNGFIFKVLKHLEESVVLWNETVDKGVTYDMGKMSKLVRYE